MVIPTRCAAAAALLLLAFAASAAAAAAAAPAAAAAVEAAPQRSPLFESAARTTAKLISPPRVPEPFLAEAESRLPRHMAFGCSAARSRQQSPHLLNQTWDLSDHCADSADSRTPRASVAVLGLDLDDRIKVTIQHSHPPPLRSSGQGDNAPAFAGAAGAPAKTKQGILPSSFVPRSADLFVTLAGVGFAADVVVAHPTDHHLTRASDRAPMATVRGHYANALSKSKHAKYSASYDFEPRFLQPLAFDSYGCPARDTSTFLALVLKHAAARDPTSKKHEMLADYTARVSTSLVRNTALMVRSYRQHCAGG